MSERYRGYHIQYDPALFPVPSCEWQFFHQDYDGEGDYRCGFAGSLEEAKQEVDLILEGAE